jgi:hypothetical protein
MPSHVQAQEMQKWLKEYEGWVPVMGGNQTSWHAPKLEEDTKLHGHVAGLMCPIIDQMLFKFHPDFKWLHVKYDALKTALKSKSQLEDHKGTLHPDFLDFLRHLGPSDHQMLVTLALNEFNIYHLLCRDCHQEEM